MSGKRLQVYEYQRLRVGEHYQGHRIDHTLIEGLARWRAATAASYWQVDGQSVRFRQYVGIVQMGTWHLEILPKLDQAGVSTSLVADRFIELLEAAGILPELPPLPAQQELRSGGLLDYLIRQYCRQLELLWSRRQKCYGSPSLEWHTSVKGPIDWSRQHRRPPGGNLQLPQFIRPYHYEHPLHHFLGSALRIARHYATDRALADRCKALGAYWPVAERPLQWSEPPDLPKHWQSTYQPAVRLGQLILQLQGASGRFGSQPAGALLFDMHHVFERFLCRQLATHRPPQVRLRFQQRHPFWQKQWLQPDIYIERNQDRIIADAKWKILPQGCPEPDDLRQLYVYQRFFEAGRGFMIFPDTTAYRERGPATYEPTIAGEGHAYDCTLLFVPVLMSGRVNTSLGQYLYKRFWEGG